jgi:tetratricopeptide (TPR) repeat protein
MAEALLSYLRESLPDELAASLSHHLTQLENADFQALFEDSLAQLLFGHTNDERVADVSISDFPLWSDYIFHRLGILLRDRSSSEASDQSPAYLQYRFFLIGLAALGAFLQSNVTGPPLPFASANVLPHSVVLDTNALVETRRGLVASLSVDGESAYKLIPNPELFCLADAVLSCPPIAKNIPAALWAKLRLNAIHQRLLSEVAPSLQTLVEGDIAELEKTLPKTAAFRVPFLLESAAIHTQHGLDEQARHDLDAATKLRHFQFALTGRLGKRTKHQQFDLSQLVVLALSKPDGEERSKSTSKPHNIDLEDEDLLPAISFTPDVQDDDSIPKALAELDAEKQPLLTALDSVILLLLASSIKNTSPEDGLTREETLPYAIRVLEGGSSNWQVYTQALLVRSRIDGYKSRTVERGLLQLQGLVDQVIADTTGDATTFLPKAKEEESAPANQRLLYVHQLASPTRWELEAELATRWVGLGGLKTALEIFERLQMWPEVAMCWANTDRDDKAREVVKKQLFEEDEKPRDPPPSDAPRLYCILGDIDKDPSWFEKAWEVSNHRYYRAQKSLGRHWYGAGDYYKAAAAFEKATKIRHLEHSTWYALGCTFLEMQAFDRAVEAFTRSVQLDDADGESWSNLAASLLNLPPKSEDPQKYRRDALNAFKQAAKLKRDNYRIWDNLLTVAASVHPPSYHDITTAQQRIIDIRGPVDGEKCVDVEILTLLVKDITAEAYQEGSHGLPRVLINLFDRSIVPLITASAPLWKLVSLVALWRNKPGTALDASEKAWRVVTVQPGWETGTEAQWNGVVDATDELVAAYESLGPREKTEGMAAGSGELVAKDWNFKARSAIRGVLGKGKSSWEDTDGYARLRFLQESLKA